MAGRSQPDVHEAHLTRQPSLPGDAVDHVWRWFAALAVLFFAGECAAWALCQLADAALPGGPALAVAVAVALAGAGGVAFAIRRLVRVGQGGLRRELDELRQRHDRQQDLERQLAGRTDLQRRLRHDLRGALSPALLTADRLVSHADPKVRRAGEIMVASIDRASALLADPVEPNPLGGP